MSQRSSALGMLFRNTILNTLYGLMFGSCIVEDTGVGAADATDTTAEPQELGLRDEIGAAIEIDEKGEDSPDLSAAARTLASARKGQAKPAPKVEDTAQVAEKAAADAKAKRDAELAALPEEERKKALAEDEKKSLDAKKAADEDAGLQAPVHWPAAVREMFAKWPADVRAQYMDRHKAMEADYTKKTQELAPIRRLNEELDEIFKDDDQDMKQNGVTRVQAIRELMGMHRRWRADPAAYLKYVAELSNIDIKTLASTPSADPAGDSPLVKELRKQVETLTGNLSKVTGAQNDQQLNAHLTQVQQFAEEKDAQGNKLRPYFDDVTKDVAALIRAARANGETLTLQDAYDRAVYANPTTRAKVLAAQDAERRAKEEAERKAKADAAKRAGFDVSGAGAATTVAATTGSVRDDLEAAMADWGGRV